MRKLYKIIGLAILIVLLHIQKVNAASATISVDKSSVNVGETITATVKYTAAAWDLKVTADNALTTSSTTHYADSSESADNVTKTFTVSYKAEKAGTATITLSGNVTDENATTSQAITESKTIEIKEKVATPASENTNTNNNTSSNSGNTSSNTTNNAEKPATKSNNANLKTLGVTPKEYDFTGFKKDKTSYSVTIPSNLNSLKVAYKTEDSNAKVKITGNSGFETGSNNEIKVVVTAEDGKTTKTYTIKVTKLATEEQQPGNVIEEEKGLFLKSLEIEGVELSPSFEKDTYSYKAILMDQSVNSVHVQAIANQEKAKISISGNQNLQEGDNTINIIVTLEGSVEQRVYQIILTKNTQGTITTNASQDLTNGLQETNTLGSLKKYIGIFTGIFVFIVAGIIVLIIILKKQDEKLEQELKEENEKNVAQEYDVFHDDEISVQNKDTMEEINQQTEEIFKKKGKHF